MANAVWLGAGVALLAAQLVLLALSRRFAYEASLVHLPIPWLVVLGVTAGVVFLALPWAVRRARGGRLLLVWIVAVGVLMRVAMLPSTPVLEDDFNRYLWDGAVVSHGINPYAHAPIAATEPEDGGPPAMVALAAESGRIAERINYPALRSIYPPVAQAAFALAYRLEPWSLEAWRAVLMAFDLATLGLLLALLRRLGRSPLWVALYWWNPLVVKELFNSAHMDALVIPFVLGALWLATRGRNVWASGALALAAGVKLWPVLLLPIVLRPLLGHGAKLAAALAAFALPLGLMAVPVIVAGLDVTSGFVAYGGSWQANDALFMALAWLAGALLDLVGAGSDAADGLSRMLVGLAVVGLALALNRTVAEEPAELCRRSMIIVAALFLLGPTPFPWYYAWLVPLLVLVPVTSLLALTALLPLYYLRFYFDARGQAVIFDNGVVWLEYLPVLALLAREWLVARRSGQSRMPSGVAIDAR